MSAQTQAVAVRERPIIFSAESVRAILNGTKTQTRRVIVPQPSAGVRYRPGGGAVEDGHGRPINPRWGVPPERLWVRETWGYWPASLGEEGRILYRAEVDDIEAHGDRPMGWTSRVGPISELTVWRSPIYMSRGSSRILLELSDVRVQRLQEISEEDAKAEGMQFHDGGGLGHSGWRHDVSYGYVQATARAALRSAWDALNSKRGYGWDKSPWVWCLTFRRVKP